MAAATTRRRCARTAATAALALAAVALAAGPAAAADDGLWYYTQTGLADVHATTQGAGITVGIIDGRIDPSWPDLVGSTLTVHEPSFCATTYLGDTAVPATTEQPDAQHATGMAALIVGTGAGVAGRPGIRGVAPQARLLAYTVLVGDATDGSACPMLAGGPTGLLERAVDQAIADHVQILSISLGENIAETEAVARALHAGIIVVAAQQHQAGGGPYPASLNGVVAVEEGTADGVAPQAVLNASTVVAPGQDILQPGADLASSTLASGSSQATAYTAGALALVWSAFPHATANQVLQDLVRNTYAKDHERGSNETWGLGPVNVRHMLAHDPTTYPDENPLLFPTGAPSAALVASPPAPTYTGAADVSAASPVASPAAVSPAAPATASATPLPSSAGAVHGGSVARAAGVAGALAALVLVVGIVVGVLLARRRRPDTGGQTPPEPTQPEESRHG